MKKGDIVIVKERIIQSKNCVFDKYYIVKVETVFKEGIGFKGNFEGWTNFERIDRYQIKNVVCTVENIEEAFKMVDELNK